MTGEALSYYALGLVAMGEVMVLNRAFYSLQEVMVPVKVSGVVLVTNVVLNFLFIDPMAHKGLALATSVSMFLNMVVLLLLLRRRLGGLEGGRILSCSWRVVLAGAITAGSIYLMLGSLKYLTDSTGILSEVPQSGRY